MKTCIIEKCGRPVSERSRFPECSRCRAVYRYWDQKPNAAQAIVDRENALDKWRDRMRHLATQTKGTKYAKVKRQFGAQVDARAAR